jgi:hypothetical protein
MSGRLCIKCGRRRWADDLFGLDPDSPKWSDLKYVFDINELLPILGPACWPFSSQFRSVRAACH